MFTSVRTNVGRLIEQGDYESDGGLRSLHSLIYGR